MFLRVANRSGVYPASAKMNWRHPRALVLISSAARRACPANVSKTPPPFQSPRLAIHAARSSMIAKVAAPPRTALPVLGNGFQQGGPVAVLELDLQRRAAPDL